MTPTIYLAPLKGVTDAIFRTAYAESFNGVDWAITPFLSTVRGIRIKPSHLKQVMPENNQQMRIIPQIISKNAANFSVMAEALFDLGYDTVNWNLGCPYPMVAKKGRGSGMLSDPKAIDIFLDQVCATLSGRISIKMRLGRQETNEIESLLPIFDRYPIESITIHPRTGIQMYNGQPHLDIFEKCLSMTRHRVIYNGDIITKQNFEGLQDRFPDIHHWMIGRGVIINPRLPSEIKGETVSNQHRILKFREFHTNLFERYQDALFGPSHLLDRMKGLWRYFSKGFQDGRDIRKRLHKSQKVEQFLSEVDCFWEQQARLKN